MNTQLAQVAGELVAAGKGILAADESTGSIGKKFEKLGIENTEENRRVYRGLLLTTPGLEAYISGVILYDETLRQSTDDGRTFSSVLQAAGIFPGIKVDMGLEPMDGSPNEQVTKGLEGLADRLAEYASLGAKFTKWRAVITIGERIPTDANIRVNAERLVQYAKIAQDVGLVPIVEPEVLMDGEHDIDACRDASERVLTALFEELPKAGVEIEGLVLKTNMVIPGKLKRRAEPEEVAKETVALFKKILPNNLPGQAFLSGGQSDIEATANLNAMAQLGPHPWNLSFSYGRALQDAPIRTWAGKAENVPVAQKALMHRARMNSLATLGTYTSALETE